MSVTGNMSVVPEKPKIVPVQVDGYGNVLVLNILESRKGHEENNFNNRRVTFEDTHQMPFFPPQNKLFGLDNYESYFSISEMTSRSYWTDPSVYGRDPQTLGTISAQTGLAIIPAMNSLLGCHHTMIVDVEYRQDDMSKRALQMASLLAEQGFIIGFNGHGAGNSNYTFHLNVLDAKETGIKVRDDFFPVVDIHDAPGIYTQLLAQGKLLSAIVLPNNKIGFVEQRLPLLKERTINTGLHGKHPFPFTYDLDGLGSQELERVYLFMKLGLGYLESITSNVVVNKLGHTVEYQHRVFDGSRFLSDEAKSFFPALTPSDTLDLYREWVQPCASPQRIKRRRMDTVAAYA